jgi:hypothetical protein
MKPQERSFQTATQVKGLSPEILHFDEADSVHLLEGNRVRRVKVSDASLVRGLRPWYGNESVLHELGRPVRLPRKGIRTNNLKRRGCLEGGTGVGSAHSRGVAGVMPCAGRPDSKGLTVMCRDQRKQGRNKRP